MMKPTNEVKDTIINALESQLGRAQDNLFRARRAFNGMTDEQMSQYHGQSRRVRRDILEGYEQWERREYDALEWVKGIETK